MTNEQDPSEYIKSLRGLEPSDDPISHLAEITLARFLGLKRSALMNGDGSEMLVEDDEWNAAGELEEYVHTAVCQYIVGTVDEWINRERRKEAGQN